VAAEDLRGFVLVLVIGIADQFVEHHQIHILQPLALEKNPVLIPAVNKSPR